jgi:hypothetical protein
MKVFLSILERAMRTHLFTFEVQDRKCLIKVQSHVVHHKTCLAVTRKCRLLYAQTHE